MKHNIGNTFGLVGEKPKRQTTNGNLNFSIMYARTHGLFIRASDTVESQHSARMSLPSKRLPKCGGFCPVVCYVVLASTWLAVYGVLAAFAAGAGLYCSGLFPCAMF